MPSLRLLQLHGYDPWLIGKVWVKSLLHGEGWRVEKDRPGLVQRVRQLKALAAKARTRDPDFDQRLQALTLPCTLSCALELRLAGLKAFGCRSKCSSLLLAGGIAMPADQEHELVRCWRLACSFLGIELPPPQRIGLRMSVAQQRAADAELEQHGVRKGYVVIVPFAGGDSGRLDRRWPHFPAFTQALLDEGRDVVVCPGPGEEALAKSQHRGTIMIAGIDLGAYLGILRRASLVVANNTGPGHMAAAIGVPLLSVLGPADRGTFGAWGPTVHVVRDQTWPDASGVLGHARALLAHAAGHRGQGLVAMDARR
ncbi:MAG TPA: glycosyltransferase family 9 protein [Burkholderiaceae bacterium]|nr:glycosyltransferase family 9 protein [Burkholderiaceae bacterium]